jgi:hypothetical protein
LPGISKWEEFAAKNRICPRWQRNFVDIAGNVYKIAEVSCMGFCGGVRNGAFVRLSLHLAIMLAAKYRKLKIMVFN